MKRSTIVGVIAVGATVLTGCKKELPPNVGSGVQKSELRNLPQFQKLRASGSVNVELKLGEVCQAEITTDDNLLSLVTTAMKGDLLEVSSAPKRKPRVPIRVRLCSNTLELLAVEGGSTVTASRLNAQALVVKAAGAAEIKLEGSATNVDVHLRTASKANLSAFSTSGAKALIDQAAALEMGHVETLDVTITGPGLVSYRGDPKVTSSRGKLGRIIRKP